MQNILKKIPGLDSAKKPCKDCHDEDQKHTHIVVQSLQQLNRYPCKLRVNGMVAIVVDRGYATYQLQTNTTTGVCDNKNWILVESSGGTGGPTNFYIVETLGDAEAQVEQGVEEGSIFFIKETGEYLKNAEGKLSTLFPETTITLVNEDNSMHIEGYTFNSNVGSHIQEVYLPIETIEEAFPYTIEFQVPYTDISSIHVTGVGDLPSPFYELYEDRVVILDFQDAFTGVTPSGYYIKISGTFFITT